jgi:hypothetical protein
MNQKAFAIFVGALMVLSVFAGFVLMGGNQTAPVTVTASDSLQTFGIKGQLVEWSFDGLNDVLEMCPENTTMAYWINMSVPGNLTDAARAALPPSNGLQYGSQMYPTKIEKLAVGYFNNTWTEFHWIKPFPVAYSGLMVPYNDYMMIPLGTDYATVVGKPVIFGPQEALRSVLDVISGDMPTGDFTLPAGEKADLQLAALGRAGIAAGGFKEFYLGVSSSESGFYLTAKYLQPDASASQRAKETAAKYGLTYSSQASQDEITGSVGKDNLSEVLMAILGP